MDNPDDQDKEPRRRRKARAQSSPQVALRLSEGTIVISPPGSPIELRGADQFADAIIIGARVADSGIEEHANLIIGPGVLEPEDYEAVRAIVDCALALFRNRRQGEL